MMDHPSSSSGARRGSAHCGRPDLAERLSTGEELSGAFADEIAAHSRGCASCSVKLSLVEQAERWLADHASSNRAALTSSTPCPSAEDLYDFGRGPGARGIRQGSERRIQAHLVDCEECRGLVATLVTRPPLPLVDALPARHVVVPMFDREPSPQPFELVAPTVTAATTQRQTSRPWWLAYAAAAAVVLGGLYVWNANRTSHAGDSGLVADGAISYPEPRSLRGSLSDALLMPHGKVLASLTPGAAGTWNAMHFQVVPPKNATAYEVIISKLPTSAWGAAQEVARFSSPTPEFDLPQKFAPQLGVGKYIWEVWAQIDGIRPSLGIRGFEIKDASIAREPLEREQTLAEPQRSSAILEWLLKNEFEFDAWTYSGRLPQSAPRDRFRATLLGR